jgi:hypothetical protein
MCKCTSVLKHTQANVDGLNIRQGTLADLPKLLPCSACLAGKLRKNRGQPDKNYTDIENLNNTIANLPLSSTASTAEKNVTPNRTVSIDWGIINKRNQAGNNNVFALFLDINTGITFLFPIESRGQAGVALQAYIQRYGKPNEVVHDNATEFVQGNFAQICLEQQITQTRSRPTNLTKIRSNFTWISSFQWGGRSSSYRDSTRTLSGILHWDTQSKYRIAPLSQDELSQDENLWVRGVMLC